MNLDEIKANVLQKLSIYKSQVLFDPNSGYMRELELILKLCYALELAIKQRDDNLNYADYMSVEAMQSVTDKHNKEIEDILK